uniref:Uncharacterized protein n=1 Tax=Rhizophora mucronata TaxID=61149 RepID=A0A2P2NZT6_RHIMU
MSRIHLHQSVPMQVYRIFIPFTLELEWQPAYPYCFCNSADDSFLDFRN